MSIRHNDLHDLTAKIVSEVSNGTKIEPELLPLSGEKLHRATRSSEVKLDITARGFLE